MTYNYKAFLTLELTKHGFPRSVNIPSIADAKEGFWIDTSDKFTRDDDCKFWIAPGQLLYVEKSCKEKG